MPSITSRAARALVAVGNAIGIAIAFPIATAACTTTVQAPPADHYVYAGNVHPDVYYQPRAAWRGHTVYWWQGHWYYPSQQGWYYLREEPPELRPYRRGAVQAPPAYGYPAAPPGAYGGPYPQGGGPYRAPPATPPPLPAPR